MTKVDLINKIQNQNQMKQNAIRTEKYWRDKCVKEGLDFEAQDNSDLMAIFSQVQKQDVPEDMACLWEQQKKSSTLRLLRHTDGIQSKYFLSFQLLIFKPINLKIQIVWIHNVIQ